GGLKLRYQARCQVTATAPPPVSACPTATTSNWRWTTAAARRWPGASPTATLDQVTSGRRTALGRRAMGRRRAWAARDCRMPTGILAVPTELTIVEQTVRTRLARCPMPVDATTRRAVG